MFGSYVVAEAMAMSLPIVCSDVGSLPELVVNKLNGFLVPNRVQSDHHVKSL
jgi:glycosyltransferase involved in cell wall biosynthesis